DELFDEDAIIAEAVQALTLYAVEALSHVLLVPREAHALSAAAGGGLHHHRITDALGDFEGFIGGRDILEMTGNDVVAGLGRELLGLDLVAHRADGFWGRSDESDAGLF